MALHFGGSPSGVTPKEFNEAIDELETALSELEQTVEEEMGELGSEIATFWDYLANKYDVEGSEAEGSNGTTIYTETIKNDGSTVATRVTTESSDGNTFTAVYTIGTNPSKTKTTTISDSGFTEVWS